MADIYPYTVLNWFPHLGSIEQVLWARYIKAYPEEYEAVEYDVKIGPVPEFSTIVNPETGGDVSALYQKKIDVLGFKPPRIDIIEVKPNAGASAVSQLKQYQYWLIKKMNLSTNPGLIIVTDKARPGLLDYATHEGVRVVIV